MEYISEPSVFNLDRIEMDPIQIYLTTGSLSTDKSGTRHIRYQSAKYHIINGILYKRGYTLPYLRCIPPTQVKDILQEIHEGVCGSHIGG